MPLCTFHGIQVDAMFGQAAQKGKADVIRDLQLKDPQSFVKHAKLYCQESLT
jgi:hypothetical protein